MPAHVQQRRRGRSGQVPGQFGGGDDDCHNAILAHGVAATPGCHYSARPDSPGHTAYGIGHTVCVRRRSPVIARRADGGRPDLPPVRVPPRTGGGPGTRARATGPARGERMRRGPHEGPERE
ncbi:hypothetical protein E5082_17690 [Streptomyces griseoluteus]|uniref:Uncharacterized protein n=1 Tax=Streptomyces griseoluteus TaxID=29306 RepID=A0A4Z1DIU0_STRGP|nr:hypothetical protein E5082_17690 [Streptomyces griseoluteus]